MEFIHTYTKDDYIKNHLKDYTFIVKNSNNNLVPIWHVDLSYENAEKTFKLFNEKKNKTPELIAILEGDYSSINQNDTRVIVPSKYYKKLKRSKEEKLLYFKQICEYLNIEY